MTQSQLALFGGSRIYPTDWFGSKWPLATGLELQEIQDVLDSYIWKGGSVGPKVKKFTLLIPRVVVTTKRSFRMITTICCSVLTNKNVS